MLLAEPLAVFSIEVRSTVGKLNFSTNRDATIPITPACQLDL